MRIEIRIPFQVFAQLEITKFVAEGENGSFCILPKHMDCVYILSRGISTVTNITGEEYYFAISDGILIKKFNQLVLLTNHAYGSYELSDLENVVKNTLEKEKQMESEEVAGVMKLELEFARRFYENSKNP